MAHRSNTNNFNSIKPKCTKHGFADRNVNCLDSHKHYFVKCTVHTTIKDALTPCDYCHYHLITKCTKCKRGNVNNRCVFSHKHFKMCDNLGSCSITGCLYEHPSESEITSATTRNNPTKRSDFGSNTDNSKIFAVTPEKNHATVKSKSHDEAPTLKCRESKGWK